MAVKTVQEIIKLTEKEIQFLLAEYISNTNFQATVGFSNNNLPGNNELLSISNVSFNLADIRIFFNRKGVIITKEEVDENLRSLFEKLEKLNKTHASVWEYVPGEPDILQYNVSIRSHFPPPSYEEKLALERRLQLQESTKEKPEQKPQKSDRYDPFEHPLIL